MVRRCCFVMLLWGCILDLLRNSRDHTQSLGQLLSRNEFRQPTVFWRPVPGQPRTQAIRGWPGPTTDNPPHEKFPAVHTKDPILDSIILLI